MNSIINDTSKMTQEINSNIRIIHVINGPITETITIRPIEEKDNKEIAALIRKVFEEFDAPKTESVYSDPLTDRLFQSFYQHPRAGYWVIEYNSNIYRIFFIFDEGQIVVLFNGFQKKTQKTPKSEIEKAFKLMEEYYEYKKQYDNRH